MSASAKQFAERKAELLRRHSRGERRNAARAVAKDMKKPFREVWERAYRIEPEASTTPGLLSTMARTVARFVVRHIVTPSGAVIHPTKGWRGKDGLPFGHKVRAA